MPYSFKNNGIAKRKNRSLCEIARCLLHQSHILKTMWSEEIPTTCYLLNMHSTKSLKNHIPKQLFIGVKQNVSHLCVFGKCIFAHISKHLRTKMDPKVGRCILIGWDMTTKGYHLLQSVNQKDLHHVTCENR